MLADGETANFNLFRDCLATPLIEKCATETPKTTRKRHVRKAAKALTPTTKATASSSISSDNSSSLNSNDAEELADFVDYIALEIFSTLPDEIRALTYSTYSHSAILQERYTLPLTGSDADAILTSLEPSTVDSLTAYGLLPSGTGAASLLLPVLNAYFSALTTAPLPPSQTKVMAEGCEICDRDWVPLTYHHLIPRFVHAKALKRGWHAEDQLNNVAWLCRACHSFVHKAVSHEDLAREYYTVDLLLERDDVQKFAQWVSKVRFKAR